LLANKPSCKVAFLTRIETEKHNLQIVIDYNGYKSRIDEQFRVCPDSSNSISELANIVIARDDNRLFLGPSSQVGSKFLKKFFHFCSWLIEQVARYHDAIRSRGHTLYMLLYVASPFISFWIAKMKIADMQNRLCFASFGFVRNNPTNIVPRKSFGSASSTKSLRSRGTDSNLPRAYPPHAISPNLHLPPFGRPGSGRRLSLPARARSRTDGRFPGYTGGRPPEIEPVKVNHADQLQLRSPPSQ
jgi:hypothetical protein